MNCYFCKHWMPKEETYGGFICRNCPVKVDHIIKTEDSALVAVSIKVFIKEKEYEVFFELDDWRNPQGRCEIAEMVPAQILANPKLPIVKLAQRKVLVTLPFLPPITPYNIKDKLSLYLTFS